MNVNQLFIELTQFKENDTEESASQHSDSLSSGVYWTEWFLSKKGNELFAEIEPEYILDRFNLCGLNTMVPHFYRAFKLITDSFDEDLDIQTQQEVDIAAKHLYGLLHARYILSGTGMEKMNEKFKEGEFGRCPRVLCHDQYVLPIGLSDVSGERSVKIYCPKCQDVYISPSKVHHSIDGAYFGTTFPHMFLLMYPQKIPPPTTEMYIPKIFGFRVHSAANSVRQRVKKRDELRSRAAFSTPL